MKPNAEAAVLEVPELESNDRMSLAPNQEGDPAPETLQADIARANLLRMRGDYKGAIDQCLSVLKREPDDQDSHILIGDIYAEQGDLGQATQWYELALDLHPTDDATRSKLSAVKERQRQRDAASAAEQIGLPSDKPSYGLYAGVLMVVFVAVAIGAFLLGQRQDSVRTEMRRVAAEAPQSQESEPEPLTSANPTVPPAGLSLPDEDRQVIASLQSRMPTGATVVSAAEDPRDRNLTATIAARPEDSDRTLAAEVGRIALANFPTAPRITVRIVKAGRLVFVGTVERERMMVASAAEYPTTPEGTEAYLAQMLSNEWPAPPVAGTQNPDPNAQIPAPTSP